MKATAQVEIDLWILDKDDNRRIDLPTKTKFVETEILLGDGNADAQQGVSMRLAAGDYNAFVLGTSASVKIRCNQDDETIKKSLRTCLHLSEKAIKEYQPTMERVLRKLVQDGKVA